MKKLLALSLALTILLALGACSKKSESVGIIGGADGPTEIVVSDGKDAPAPTATDKKVLVAACSADFPPYEYMENGQIVGAEVEILQAIAEKIGFEVKFEDMIFESVIPSIQSGKYDIGMSGLTVTDERKLIVNFTDSYTTSCQAIIVKEDSPITCADDLFNNIGKYKIGVQLATTGDLYATDDFGAENVEQYDKGPDAVLALNTDKIDCVIIDEAVAKAYVAANTGLKTLETAYVIEDYALALNKDDTELLDQMNAAIQELMADGTIPGIMDQYITE